MIRYEQAKQRYAKIGIDSDKSIETLKQIPISMHCLLCMMYWKNCKMKENCQN